MTAPAGYARARKRAGRGLDRLWSALRRARRPLSMGEIAERGGVSRSQAKHALQAARDLGWIEVASYDVIATAGPGGVRVPLYRLTAAAPAELPLQRQGPGGAFVFAPEAAASGAELAALRRARGWTLRQAAAAIGVAAGRTVRRYEGAATLPPAVAERVRALATP